MGLIAVELSSHYNSPCMYIRSCLAGLVLRAYLGHTRRRSQPETVGTWCRNSQTAASPEAVNTIASLSPVTVYSVTSHILNCLQCTTYGEADPVWSLVWYLPLVQWCIHTLGYTQQFVHLNSFEDLLSIWKANCWFAQGPMKYLYTQRFSNKTEPLIVCRVGYSRTTGQAIYLIWH